MRSTSKGVALFAMNVLTAAIGTEVFSYTFRPFFRKPTDFAARMRFEDYLTAAVASALGFVVAYIWKTRSAKWVWIAGVCLFSWRAADVWFGHPQLASVLGPRPMFWEFAPGSPPWNMPEIGENFIFGLVLIRTFFYSAGAALCSTLNLSLQGRQTAAPLDEPRSNIDGDLMP